MLGWQVSTIGPNPQRTTLKTFHLPFQHITLSLEGSFHSRAFPIIARVNYVLYIKNIPLSIIIGEWKTHAIYLKSVAQLKYIYEKYIAKLGSRHQCECISQKNCQKVESLWLVGQSETLFSNTKYKMSQHKKYPQNKKTMINANYKIKI